MAIANKCNKEYKPNKNEYNKNNLNWVYKNNTWVDLNSGVKLTRKDVA